MNVIKEQIQALPRGSILLHIGPHKTGTTSLQAALRENSATLKAHGVEYLAQDGKPAANRVARSLLRLPFIGKEVVPYAEWEQFAHKVNQSDAPRIILSGEEFSFCGSKEIHELARTFGLDRLHVVITIRPIARVLPSQWQLDLKSGAMIQSFHKWLDHVLHPSLIRRCASLLGFQHPFWFRHHHDELYKRWAEELSQSKVTLVIVDDANPNAQYESFGKLLGVPSGVIRASSLRNTSMKQLQADTLLQVHKILRAEGWSTPRFKREEFMKYLKQAGYIPDHDVPVLLPEWAKFEVGEISESVAAVLQQPGVRLMGDVSLLESNRIRTANPSNEIEDSASMLAMKVVEKIKSNRTLRRLDYFELASKMYRRMTTLRRR
jgi:hypothetical protein